MRRFRSAPRGQSNVLCATPAPCRLLQPLDHSMFCNIDAPLRFNTCESACRYVRLGECIACLDRDIVVTRGSALGCAFRERARLDRHDKDTDRREPLTRFKAGTEIGMPLQLYFDRLA